MLLERRSKTKKQNKTKLAHTHTYIYRLIPLPVFTTTCGPGSGLLLTNLAGIQKFITRPSIQ